MLKSTMWIRTASPSAQPLIRVCTRSLFSQLRPRQLRRQHLLRLSQPRLLLRLLILVAQARQVPALLDLVPLVAQVRQVPALLDLVPLVAQVRQVPALRVLLLPQETAL